MLNYVASMAPRMPNDLRFVRRHWW